MTSNNELKKEALDLINQFSLLKIQMVKVACRMENFPDKKNKTITQRAEELKGAASILDGWGMGVEEDYL